VETYQRILCKLAIRDDTFIKNVVADDEANLAAASLDDKTYAFARLASLIVLDADPPSYMWAINKARKAGATNDEIVGTLVAVMPALGSARVVSAAPKLGLALGYDVGEALEDRDFTA
jgi:4-carboxymuconolactone decarboxylase